jgi:2-dehydropantoate 2-reductase
VVGAGALGTLYGACLARAGLEVQLLGREAHAAAIRDAGEVVVEGIGGRWTTPLRATSRPDEVEPAELVILLTKSQDARSALGSLGHVRDSVEVAVSLQNGVEKDEILREWCGAKHVLGGSTMVGGTLERPGAVRHTLRGVTYLGELGGGESERAHRLARLLQAGGLDAQVVDDVESVEWSKLVHASPSMSLTALARLPFHEMLTDEGLGRCYVEILREGAEVARRAGVELGDWPGMFPVATVASLPVEDAVELVRERGRQMATGGATAVTVSMLRDLELARPLELDAVHGFLAAEAARRGVDAPLTRLTLALLSALDSGARATARA